VALTEREPRAGSRRSLRHDFFLTATAYGIAAFAKTAYFVAVARHSGPTMLGDATTIVAIGTLVSVVTAAGFGPAATRAIAASRARNDTNMAWLAFSGTRRASTVSLAGLAVITAVVSAAWFGDLWIAWNLGMFILTYGLYQFYRAVDYGTGQVGPYLRTEIVANALLLCGTALVLVTNSALLLPFGLAYATFTAIAHRRTRATLRPKSRIENPQTVARRGAVRESRQSGIWDYATLNIAGTLASMASIQLGVVVARQALGHEAAGLFGAAFALLLPVLYLPRALATALLPRNAADLATGNTELIGSELSRLTLGSAMVSLPLAMLGVALAEPLITVTSGARFAAGADTLGILLIASFFLVVSIPAVNVLSARDVRDLRVPFLASVSGLVVTGMVWAVSLATSPRLTGVAAGVLAGSIVKSIWPVIYCFRRYRLRQHLVWASSGVALSGGAALLLVPGGFVYALVAVAIGAVATTAVLDRRSQKPAWLAHLERVGHTRLAFRTGPLICVGLTIVGLGYALAQLRTVPLWPVVFVGAIAAGVVTARRRGLAHPLAWFPIVYGLYFLIGAQDLVEVAGTDILFRAYVEPERVLRLAAFGLAAFYAGAWLMVTLRRRRGVSPRRTDRKADQTILRARRAGRLLWTIGAVASCAVIVRYGVLLANPVGRADTSHGIRILSLFLVPGALLLTVGESRQRRSAAIMLASSALLILPAYRTPVLLLIGTYLVTQLVQRRVRQITVIVGALILVIFSLATYNLRLAETGASPYESDIVPTGILRYVPVLTPLYYGVAHEGVSVFGEVVNSVPSDSDYFRGQLELSSVESLLPGHQASSRDLVTEVAYQTTTPPTTLTPTVLGGPYLDFGLTGIVLVMFLLGAATLFLYELLLTSDTIAPLRALVYAYWAVLLALSIHTGLLDSGLLIVLPIAALAAYRISGRADVRVRQWALARS
jgi:O-antigen/teichoic acid export membrane protein